MPRKAQRKPSAIHQSRNLYSVWKRGQKVAEYFSPNRLIRFVVQPFYWALINKPSGLSSSTAFFVSRIYVAGFYSLASLFVFSILFSLFPIQISKLDWYLRQAGSVASSMPLLIASLCFAVAGILHSDRSSRDFSLLAIVGRIGRFGSILLMVSLPFLIGFSIRFANQNLNLSRAQQFKIQAEFNEFKLEANRLSTSKDFVSLLQAKGLSVSSRTDESLSLPNIRSSTLNILSDQVERQLQEIYLQRRRRLITDVSDAFKLILSWLAFIFFFSTLQQFSASIKNRW